MSGDARWLAAAIAMDSGGKIAIDGSRGNGRWRRNGWRDGGVIMMGNGVAVTQWLGVWYRFVKFSNGPNTNF
jgi:hypothetical protein